MGDPGVVHLGIPVTSDLAHFSCKNRTRKSETSGLRQVLLEKFKRCWRLWQVRVTVLSHENSRTKYMADREGSGASCWAADKHPRHQVTLNFMKTTQAFGPKQCLQKGVQDQELFYLLADQLECLT